MAHQLKTMTMSDGTVVTEKCCEKYVCRYCGGKAVGCNYVANMCLQIAARHEGLCGAYVNDEKYRGYVSECSTCLYYDKDSAQCTLEES